MVAVYLFTQVFKLISLFSRTARKNVLLSEYHRQETCTCYLSMGGNIKTYCQIKHFFIEEHFEDSKHYALLSRCSHKTNIKKNQNKPFCFQGHLEDSKQLFGRQALYAV